MVLHKWKLLAAPVGVLALGLSSHIPTSALAVLAGFTQCMVVYATTGHEHLLRVAVAMLLIVGLVTFAPVPDLPGPLGLLSDLVRQLEPIIGVLALLWASVAGFILKPQAKPGATSVPPGGES